MMLINGLFMPFLRISAQKYEYLLNAERKHSVFRFLGVFFLSLNIQLITTPYHRDDDKSIPIDARRDTKGDRDMAEGG